MFSFHCPKCFRKSFSAGIPRCLYCGTTESTTAEGGNFHPPEPEAPSEFGAGSGSKNYHLPNDMQKAEVVSIQYRKSNKANVRVIMDNSAGHKKSRSEVCGVNEDVLPTFRKQGGINYNFESEKRNTNAIEFEKGCLDGISDKFPNKESNPYNLSIQEFGNLKNTIYQNSATNFGNFQGIQDDQPPENSDPGASRKETTRRIDNILAVPGPSGYRENKTSNFREGKLQSRFSLEVQSVWVADKNAFICGGCKGEIDGHLSEHEGRYLYQCCSCDYASDIKNNFQMHTRIHDRYHCNICGEITLEKDAHIRRRICELCNKTFQCKSLLEQHTLEHEAYYYVHCRVCRNCIAEHIDPEEMMTVYKCCECPFTSIQRCNLLTHLYTHSDLNLFKCDSCQKRFTHKSSLFRHMRTHFK